MRRSMLTQGGRRAVSFGPDWDAGYTATNPTISPRSFLVRANAPVSGLITEARAYVDARSSTRKVYVVVGNFQGAAPFYYFRARTRSMPAVEVGSVSVGTVATFSLPVGLEVSAGDGIGLWMDGITSKDIRNSGFSPPRDQEYTSVATFADHQILSDNALLTSARTTTWAGFSVKIS